MPQKRIPEPKYLYLGHHAGKLVARAWKHLAADFFVVEPVPMTHPNQRHFCRTIDSCRRTMLGMGATNVQEA